MHVEKVLPVQALMSRGLRAAMLLKEAGQCCIIRDILLAPPEGAAVSEVNDTCK